MPLYDFRCPSCVFEFSVNRSASARGREEPCPQCSTTAEQIVGKVGFLMKGDGWTGKNLTIASQMKEKNQRLAEKMAERKREAPPLTLIPNVGGEQVGTWSEAKRLAASKGKDTSSYEALVRKEAKK